MRATVLPYRRVKFVLESGETVVGPQVGRLVPRDGCDPTARGGMVRVINDDDCIAAADETVRSLIASGVTSVVVELNEGSGTYAADQNRIGAAILAACGAAGLSLDGSTMRETHPETKPEYKAPWSPPPGLPPTAAELSQDLADLLGAIPGVAQPTPKPLRADVAGIDPGTRRIAVVAAQTSGSGVVFVDKHVFEIGTVVKGKTLVTDADVRHALTAISNWLRARGVRRVIVENSAGSMGARSFELTKLNRISGAIEGRLSAEYEVSTTTEAGWYARLIRGKRARRARSDPRLSAILSKGFCGTWPTTTNADERDAAGLVLASLVTDAAKSSRRSPAPTGPRPHNAKRAATAAARRKALGCTCSGRRRHRRDCPAYAPTSP